jgi:mono/diheme cytochrome c family protein
MFRTGVICSKVSLATTMLLAGLLAVPPSAQSQSSRVEVARGKYLVTFGGCVDCHTPGYFFGKPDMPKALSGSEVGFEIPELGVFYGPNLTPDKETGLGTWTKAQIVTALQKGTRRRPHAGPDHAVARLCQPHQAGRRGDRRLSQKPAAHQEQGAGPVRPQEKATSFVMKVVPPQK